MGLRSLFFGLFLCWCVVHCQDNFEITFLGQGLFPLGSNATLRCQVLPVPEDPSSMTVSWWFGSLLKLARSVADQNQSFVYDSAKPELRPRFSVSSESFSEGFAEATIQDIRINDEGTYRCDLDINRKQAQTSFDIRVYKLPIMKIENINTELDIRPQPEEPSTAPENPTETSEDESGNSTAVAEVPDAGATESTEEDEEGTEPPTEEGTEVPTEEAISNPPVTDDGKVTIVHCLVEDVYPMPSKIIFRTDSGKEWEMFPDDYFDKQDNSDGSFNVTARLRIEPTSEIDQTTISCVSFITDEDHRSESPKSNLITVKHSTTGVNLNMFPSIVKEGQEVTIDCQADGNPRPTVILTKPDDNTADLSENVYWFIADRDAAGFYTCSASNGDTDFTQSEKLLVHWMDDVTIEGPADAVQVNHYVELVCAAESNSHVTFEWYKNGELQRNKNSKTLTIEQARVDDSGDYKCEASSDVQKKEATYKLTVEQGCYPIFSSHVSASTENKDNFFVSVTCTADGNPSCQMELSSFGDHKPTISENEARIEIANLPKQNSFMEFVCIATNSVNSTRTNTTVAGDYCCIAEGAEGASTGVVIIVVVVAILAVIGLFVACYVIRTRKAKKATLSKGKTYDDVEAEKLAAPTEEDKY